LLWSHVQKYSRATDLFVGLHDREHYSWVDKRYLMVMLLIMYLFKLSVRWHGDAYVLALLNQQITQRGMPAYKVYV